MPDDEFLLKFPLRVIINNDLGSPIAIGSRNDPTERLPVFTDEDLCDTFMNRAVFKLLNVGESMSVSVLIFDGARQFAAFCDALEYEVTHFCIDPSGDNNRGLVVPAEPILTQMRAAEF